MHYHLKNDHVTIHACLVNETLWTCATSTSKPFLYNSASATYFKNTEYQLIL